MAIHINTWQFTSLHGNSQQYMTIHIDTWQFTAIHGKSQQYMAIHSNTWQYMVNTFRRVMQYNRIALGRPYSSPGIPFRFFHFVGHCSTRCWNTIHPSVHRCKPRLDVVKAGNCHTVVSRSGRYFSMLRRRSVTNNERVNY